MVDMARRRVCGAASAGPQPRFRAGTSSKAARAARRWSPAGWEALLLEQRTTGIKHCLFFFGFLEAWVSLQHSSWHSWEQARRMLGLVFFAFFFALAGTNQGYFATPLRLILASRSGTAIGTATGALSKLQLAAAARGLSYQPLACVLGTWQQMRPGCGDPEMRREPRRRCEEHV